jgi:hypothetical protein
VGTRVGDGTSVAEGVADAVLATVEVGDTPFVAPGVGEASPTATELDGDGTTNTGVDDGIRVAEGVDGSVPVGVNNVDADVLVVSGARATLAVEVPVEVMLAVWASTPDGVEAGRGRTSTKTSRSRAANTTTSATHSSVGVTVSRRESLLFFLFITLFPLGCHIGHRLHIRYVFAP